MKINFKNLRQQLTPDRDSETGEWFIAFDMRPYSSALGLPDLLAEQEYTNYFLGNQLEAAILQHGVFDYDSDHEYSCCYWYFPDSDSAFEFFDVARAAMGVP